MYKHSNDEDLILSKQSSVNLLQRFTPTKSMLVSVYEHRNDTWIRQNVLIVRIMIIELHVLTRFLSCETKLSYMKCPFTTQMCITIFATIYCLLSFPITMFCTPRWSGSFEFARNMGGVQSILCFYLCSFQWAAGPLQSLNPAVYILFSAQCLY